MLTERVPFTPDHIDSSPTARLRQLLDIGRSLTAELDLDAVLVRVLETARTVCGARFSALGVLDDERRELSQFLTSGEDAGMHDAVGHLPRGRGILGLLIDQPVPIRLHDVSEHPRSYGFPPGHPPMKGFLGAPIVIRGEAWGNLYLTEKAGADDFDDEDLEAIVVLSQWAAIAIDNARLFGSSEQRRAELERAVRGMEASRDIALALGGETDLQRVLELIAKRARALVEADSLLIWLVDGESLKLATYAGNATPPAGASVPVEGSTSGEALRTGRPVRVDDVAKLGVGPATFGLAGARSALIVPLRFRGRRLGVLAAFDHIGQTSVFSRDDERSLEAFAASAATAVATARSVEEQRLRLSIAAAEGERRRWARDLHDETLQGLGGLKLALAAALKADADAVNDQLRASVVEVERQIAALRGIIADLRPPALDELGLEPALRSLAERQTATHGLVLQLDLELGERRLDPEIETVAYRVGQEALSNVVKHAAAKRVRLELRATEVTLDLTVHDDGLGIDPERPNESGSRGYGLVGMSERAELVGGSVTVASRSGGGTTVRLSLPLV
jgi:signal transduction histidine kinase